MKTDRELLEMAAKAAGVDLSGGVDEHGYYEENWNPLTDDGDALRLAVKLDLAVVPYPIYAKPKHSVIVKQYQQGSLLREALDVLIDEIEIYGDDAMAATRRAIVRAAAEIGKAK